MKKINFYIAVLITTLIASGATMYLLGQVNNPILIESLDPSTVQGYRNTNDNNVDIIGVWWRCFPVPSANCERYRFYSEGKYEFATSEYVKPYDNNSNERTLSSSGTYVYEGDSGTGRIEFTELNTIVGYGGMYQLMEPIGYYFKNEKIEKRKNPEPRVFKASVVKVEPYIDSEGGYIL